MALFELWLKDGERQFLLAPPKTMSYKGVWMESLYPSPRYVYQYMFNTEE